MEAKGGKKKPTKNAKSEKAGKAPALAVKDKVTWDDGTESGTILSIKGKTAKVKDSDGDTVPVPLSDLKPAKAGKKAKK